MDGKEEEAVDHQGETRRNEQDGPGSRLINQNLKKKELCDNVLCLST